jgi:hypothetical protein
LTTTNISTVIDALNSLRTVQTSDIISIDIIPSFYGDIVNTNSIAIPGYSTDDALNPLCIQNHITNYTITINSHTSSLPHFQLQSNLYNDSSFNFSINNEKDSFGNKNDNFNSILNSNTNIENNVFNPNITTRNIISLQSYDNRNDDIKLCNGVGKCDFPSGLCSCPYVRKLTESFEKNTFAV